MGDGNTSFDLAIVGGGMVGASIAYFTAPARRVLLLEAEAAPGYHATGRSAALFMEAYGPPSVRALTRASRRFFDAAPDGFAPDRLLAPRGSLFVGGSAQQAQLLALREKLSAEGVELVPLEAAGAQSLVPALRPEAAAHALYDAAACDIDVHALLHGFLRGATGAGATVLTGARVNALAPAAYGWDVGTADGRRFKAAKVVNAAGAWADQIAALAGISGIGIEPRRRSAFRFEPPQGMNISAWPAVSAIDESWYFKPDAGLLLGSPANADPVPPHDVVPEDMDIALGIHNIELATTFTIHRPKSAWAGLRCFVADGEPVCGFDTASRFFWAAALGGYGIQTAPGFGRLCAGLLIHGCAPADLARLGVDAAALAPSRLSGNGLRI